MWRWISRLELPIWVINWCWLDLHTDINTLSETFCVNCKLKQNNIFFNDGENIWQRDKIIDIFDFSKKVLILSFKVKVFEKHFTKSSKQNWRRNKWNQILYGHFYGCCLMWDSAPFKFDTWVSSLNKFVKIYLKIIFYSFIYLNICGFIFYFYAF